MIKDTVEISIKFKNAVEKIMSQAREYNELTEALFKKEGLEPIEVAFLQDMARDILAIPDRGLIDKTISKDAKKM